MVEKITIMMITGIFVLAGVLFFVSEREKNEWKRLDCEEYSTMDDLALLKRMMEIDYNTRQEVDAVGGGEAMLAKGGGRLGEKERKRFENLVFLNDAFVGMGASHTVVMAILDRAKKSDHLKTEMNVDDVVAVLPDVAELYEILCKIGTSPVDIAEWLVDDYLSNTSEEKRSKVAKRIRKYAEVQNSITRLWVLSNLGSRK